MISPFPVWARGGQAPLRAQAVLMRAAGTLPADLIRESSRQAAPCKHARVNPDGVPSRGAGLPGRVAARATYSSSKVTTIPAKRAYPVVVLRCHKAKPFTQVEGLPVSLPPPNTVVRQGPGDR
jgi:hypothetical protein